MDSIPFEVILICMNMVDLRSRLMFMSTCKLFFRSQDCRKFISKCKKSYMRKNSHKTYRLASFLVKSRCPLVDITISSIQKSPSGRESILLEIKRQRYEKKK